MKTKLYFLFFVMTGLFTGCYDDKGNYDYEMINTIEIPEFGTDYYPWAALGDTIRFHPELHFKSGDGEKMDLSYEWTFAGKKISDQLDLYWIIDTIATSEFILRVTDNERGIVYSNYKKMRVDSPFKSQGWVVLAEKEGHSTVSFVRQMIENYLMDEEMGDVYYALNNQTFEDVYEENNKQVLGSKPVKVLEHFSSVAPGEILVIQQGEPGCIDIDGNTFLRDINVNEAFMDQQYPTGFQPVNAAYMRWLDVIENEDGQLFTRLKFSTALFNSGYFVTEPVRMKNEEVRGRLIPSDWKSVSYTLIHDLGVPGRAENRLVVLFDVRNTFEGVNYAGRVDPLPVPPDGWPDGFVPLTDLGENELIYMKDRGGNGDYFMILKTPDGKYLQQCFTLSRSYSGIDLSYPPGSFSVREMPAVRYEDYKLLLLSSDSYLILAKGNDLYYYNWRSPEDGIKPYWHFDSPVAAMAASIQGWPQLGVGLENGQFVILNVNLMKNRPENKRLYWQTPGDRNLGKVVDVIYKTSGKI